MRGLRIPEYSGKVGRREGGRPPFNGQDPVEEGRGEGAGLPRPPVPGRPHPAASASGTPPSAARSPAAAQTRSRSCHPPVAGKDLRLPGPWEKHKRRLGVKSRKEESGWDSGLLGGFCFPPPVFALSAPSSHSCLL